MEKELNTKENQYMIELDNKISDQLAAFNEMPESEKQALKSLAMDSAVIAFYHMYAFDKAPDHNELQGFIYGFVIGRITK